MDDKYEKFKKWFKSSGYCLTKIQNIETERCMQNVENIRINFVCMDSPRIFEEFERKYCDKELEDILEDVFIQVDNEGWDIDDIEATKNKIKKLLK